MDTSTETAETAENFVFPAERYHALVFSIYGLTVLPTTTRKGK